MKGLITSIKRMAVHDGAGLRTTVFFKGCPLRCLWCHNPETLSFEAEIGFHPNKCAHCGSCAEVCTGGALTPGKGFEAEKCVHCYQCIDVCPTSARTLFGEEWESDALAEQILQDRSFFVNSGGGVTFSGGECLCQIEFAVELARLLHEKSISVDIDTCGYVSFSAFEKIIPYVDEFLARTKNIRRIKVLGYHSFSGSKYEAVGRENTLPNVKVTRDDVQAAVEILRTYGLDAINGMDGD